MEDSLTRGNPPRHRISVVYAAEISGKKPIVVDRGQWRDGSVKLRNFSVVKGTPLCALFFLLEFGGFYRSKVHGERDGVARSGFVGRTLTSHLFPHHFALSPWP